MKKLLSIATVALLSSTVVFADIAKPGKSPTSNGKSSIETTLDIRLDGEAKEARLIIPRSQIRQLRAELESLDDGSDNTAAAVATTGTSRMQTIMSGLFLSLAFVFGGIWFVRSGRAATKAGAVSILVISFVATAATFVFANAGPPPEARSINGKMFASAVHMYGVGWGKIKLEVSDDDRSSVRLIVPNPPKTTGTPSDDE
jgi:hypothetical protein